MTDEEIIKMIKDVIEKGFEDQGYPLNERDRWIIDLSVKTTAETIDK